MRTVTTPWNRFRVGFEIVAFGFGQTGMSGVIEVAVQRISDSKWWSGAAWGSSYADFAVTEVDATNLPGVYEVSIAAANLDHALGIDGYRVVFLHPTEGVREHVLVHTTADPRAVVDTLLQSQATGSGSFTSGTAPAVAATIPVGSAVQAAGFGGGSPVFDSSSGLNGFMLATVTAHASRFYPTLTANSVTAARCGTLVGSRVRRFRSSTGVTYVERIASVSTDYFTLEQDDGTAPSASIASGDVLLIAPPDTFSQAYLARTPIDGATTTAGTLGDLLRRMIRLRNHNSRTIYTSFNAAGRPTAGAILLYTSAADAASDSAPWGLAVGRYDFAMTYDGSGRLTEYESVKTS